VRSGLGLDNITYTLPITVPATATAGTITVNGNATLKPTLTWAALTGSSGGVLNIPANTTIGNFYYISPFDAATQRFATVVFTAGTNEVLAGNSFSVSYTNGVVNNVISNGVGGNNPMDGVLTANVQLPIITTNTVATATITGTGGVIATLGAIPNTVALNIDGDIVNIPGNWNVQIQVNPNIPGAEQWLKFNNTLGTSIIDRDTGFNISGLENTTGASRTATAIISNRNTRVLTAPDVNHTITITQAG
jgi:hypothetical protein